MGMLLLLLLLPQHLLLMVLLLRLLLLLLLLPQVWVDQKVAAVHLAAWLRPCLSSRLCSHVHRGHQYIPAGYPGLALLLLVVVVLLLLPQHLLLTA